MNSRALVQQLGVTRQIPDADVLIAGSGVTTNAGNLTISAAGGTINANNNLSLIAGVGIVALAGAGAFDLSAATGIFKTPTGAVTIGPGAVGVSGAASFTAAGTGLAVTNGATVGGALGVTGAITGASASLTGAGTALTVTNNATVSGTLTAPTVDAAAAMSIGGATATTITIGRIGQQVTIAGNLQVSGTEVVVGGTTFQNNETFQGTVGFQGAVTVGTGGGVISLDFNAANGRLGSAANPNVLFLKEVNHTLSIDASTTATTVGAVLTVSAGVGAVSQAGPGAGGGILNVQGGLGGAGAVANNPGVGGAVNVIGGAAGGLGGGSGTAPGGAASIDGGPPTGASSGGAVTIGAVNAASIGIGRSGVATTVTGNFVHLTGSFTHTGNAASSLTTSAGALTITSAAAATWGTAAGALSVNGFSGLNLQVASSNLLVGAAGSLIVQAGVTLSVTGSGMINLPSLFQINGVAVSANVTSANLGTLTGGGASFADALHTHAGLGGGTITGLTTAGLTSGQFGYISANNVVTATDAAAQASSHIVGAYQGSAGTVLSAGTVPNAQFTTAGGSPTPGATVYVALASDDSATGAGKLTATAPVTVGQCVVPAGYCIDNSNYAGSKTCKIVLEPGTLILL